MIQCPRCGLQVTELHAVPGDLSAKLEMTGESASGDICAGCMSDLKRSAASSSGGVLMAQERAKEQHRLQLWKGRVSLIKKARFAMGQKFYSEAAVSYEKYLKILEIVFDVKSGEKLKPELFKDSARTTELTVVTSVYWDLLRIYDTSDKYTERQIGAARQLAVFLRFTPIYPDIIKKAQAFVRSAKHPKVIKQFIKLSAASRPRCFIATAAFGTPYAVEVQTLRFFRDQTLRNSLMGRRFICLYYKYSPRVACLLDKQAWLKPTVRGLLRLMIKCVS